jgi:hypothetical protein
MRRLARPLGTAQRLSVFAVGACPPAYDRGFDALAGVGVGPIIAGPSTGEGNQICTDVILAKDLERPVRRRCAFVGESIDALLSRCHQLD